jgi:soluble lytic murein transglycosylase-like protein
MTLTALTAGFSLIFSRIFIGAAMTASMLSLTISAPVFAGAQAEEKLVPSVQNALASAIADRAAPRLIGDPRETQAWLAEMSTRLAKRMPDSEQRAEFLITAQYESSRAGLDPQLVLAVITHESAFRKYAISSASARGFMQVMPFWVKLIGTGEHNLFHLRTNLRYGCVILRHYLDIERGDVVRALARYNGSLGRYEYPNVVMGYLESRWKWSQTPYANAASAANAVPAAPSAMPAATGSQTPAAPAPATAKQ